MSWELVETRYAKQISIDEVCMWANPPSCGCSWLPLRLVARALALSIVPCPPAQFLFSLIRHHPGVFISHMLRSYLPQAQFLGSRSTPSLVTSLSTLIPWGARTFANAGGLHAPPLSMVDVTDFIGNGSPFIIGSLFYPECRF